MKQNIKQPTYHRQRFLLAALLLFGKKLTVTNLQKLIFLTQEESDCHYFDFLPYRFGCYSFQLQADIEVLEKQQWLSIHDNQIELRTSELEGLVKNYGKPIEKFLASDASSLRGDNLIGYIYKNFPFYAINSEIAERVLDNQEVQKIRQLKQSLSSNEGQTLFTVGYEGISFEAYINKLLQADVKLLCDVRKNPYSRKLGFSINSLSTILPKIGIAYIHLPELGIVSEKRKGLSVHRNYENLFNDYRTALSNSDKKQSLQYIIELLSEHKRIALTCFEHKPSECHRHCISDYLCDNFGIQQKHL